MTGLNEKSTMESVRYDDSITIPTLTKLLETNIVPNNFLGSLTSLIIFLDILLSLSLSFLILADFREKKATSEPEISAEAAINITNMTNPINISVVIGKNLTFIALIHISECGSVSNFWFDFKFYLKWKVIVRLTGIIRGI